MASYQEPNVGKGYIKELCFSPDGRVIVSPFGNGIRLLTFNQQCADMPYNMKGSTITGSGCYGVEKEPAYTLHQLSVSTSHSDVVVTTKFSPIHPLFVSGCLGGRIVWHQPLLWISAEMSLKSGSDESENEQLTRISFVCFGLNVCPFLIQTVNVPT